MHDETHGEISRPAQQAASPLSPVLRALAEGLEPLGPLAAQLLWIGQPVLAALGQGEAAGELAERLNGTATEEGDAT